MPICLAQCQRLKSLEILVLTVSLQVKLVARRDWSLPNGMFPAQKMFIFHSSEITENSFQQKNGHFSSQIYRPLNSIKLAPVFQETCIALAYASRSGQTVRVRQVSAPNQYIWKTQLINQYNQKRKKNKHLKWPNFFQECLHFGQFIRVSGHNASSQPPSMGL